MNFVIVGKGLVGSQTIGDKNTLIGKLVFPLLFNMFRLDFSNTRGGEIGITQLVRAGQDTYLLIADPPLFSVAYPDLATH